MHTRLHETMLSERQMEMRILGTRQIDDPIYVLHVGWRMVRRGAGGVRHASESREGIWRGVRAGDRFEIVASHNSDTIAMPVDHPLAAITGGAAQAKRFPPGASLDVGVAGEAHGDARTRLRALEGD
jgi:hypothetical protein